MAQQNGPVATVVAILVLGALAVGVAAFLRRRDRPEPQQGASYEAPVQLHRGDFARPDAPWLVVLFSSTTCLACNGTWDKAVLLESDEVAVVRADSVEQRALHQRYGVDAVPMLVVADAGGAVRRSFIGEPTATDLWAALAELREPGSVPPSCTHD